MKGSSTTGLLMLLLSLTLLVFLFMQFYLSPREHATDTQTTLQPMNQDGSVPANRLEEYNADIDAARNVQNMVDTQNELLEHQSNLEL